MFWDSVWCNLVFSAIRPIMSCQLAIDSLFLWAFLQLFFFLYSWSVCICFIWKTTSFFTFNNESFLKKVELKFLRASPIFVVLFTDLYFFCILSCAKDRVSFYGFNDYSCAFSSWCLWFDETCWVLVYCKDCSCCTISWICSYYPAFLFALLFPSTIKLYFVISPNS